jgi:ring-1,2-phenylacetyl-CoA epoxidase subunit PaaD
VVTVAPAAGLQDAVWEILRTVEDPELPISIVDLGLVREVHAEPGRVTIHLMPTWSGCPALGVIRGRIREALLALPGVAQAIVEYTYDEPWTLERMTAEGRERLRTYGLAVPACRFAEPAVCPYCGSHDVMLDSLFGPTMCRATYRCRSCRNPFERFKPPVEPASS